MKSLPNRILTVALLTLMASAPDVHAQWHLGGLLEINRAFTGINPEPSGNRTYHARNAFGIGAVVDYPLRQHIDLHGQIILIGKGNTIKDPDLAGDMIWKATYVEIPLLVRYTFQNEASAQPYVIAGPSFGLLRSATLTVDGESAEDDEDAKKFDMGMVVGVGASMAYGTRKIFGEVRYAHGLVDVVDVSEFDVMHRGVQFLAGVTFPMGKK